MFSERSLEWNIFSYWVCYYVIGIISRMRAMTQTIESYCISRYVHAA